MNWENCSVPSFPLTSQLPVVLINTPISKLNQEASEELLGGKQTRKEA